MPSARLKPAGPLTRAAGSLAVSALTALRLLPVDVAYALLNPLLALYPGFRSAQARRLRACFEASPFSATLGIEAYYRSRLHLLLRGLEMHGKAPSQAAPGAQGIRIEGLEHYATAAETGRPIALVGLHSGLFELLHRIPQVPEGKPFLILTSEAFSPPLTEFMARGRETGGKKILWVGGKGDRSLERGLRAVAKARGVIALMADQHPGGAGDMEYLRLWERISVPYPGRLLRFLITRDFTLLPVSTRMEGRGEALFRFHPAWNRIAEPEKEPQAREAGSPPFRVGEELPGKVARFLEEAIAAAPEQWNWSYPKIVPAG